MCVFSYTYFNKMGNVCKMMLNANIFHNTKYEGLSMDFLMVI